MNPGLKRREFLGGAVALGVAGYAEMAAAAAEKKSGRASGKLPARGEFVIRNAYVMTMDPTLGDLARGDVHVKNGEIAAVGAGLKTSGGLVIDGRGMIVLPGFVDTHWHMWNTLLRSMAGDQREHGYFPTVATLGKVFTPDDMYQGTRLSAAEALFGGITFVQLARRRPSAHWPSSGRGLPAKPFIASLPPAEVEARGRRAIAEMGGRFLLLGPDCSINPDTPDAVMDAARAAAR